VCLDLGWMYPRSEEREKKYDPAHPTRD
jgi:hypothetical protein